MDQRLKIWFACPQRRVTMIIDDLFKVFVFFCELIAELMKIVLAEFADHFLEGKDYLFLNFCMAILECSLSISFPLIAARSISSLSQCSIPCQKILFISAIACGLACARDWEIRWMDSSIPMVSAWSSAYKPCLLAQSALRHMDASMDNCENAENPIFRSTA